MRKILKIVAIKSTTFRSLHQTVTLCQSTAHWSPSSDIPSSDLLEPTGIELAGSAGGGGGCVAAVAARASSQAATLPISAPQCLHLVAPGFRSSERHAGQVLVGGGSENTALPTRAMTYL